MSGPLERDTAFGAKQETESEHDGEPDQPHEHLGGMAGGSLADLNYGGVPGSSADDHRAARTRHPAALVVPRELQIVALARHPDDYPADAGPGVEPGA